MFITFCYYSDFAIVCRHISDGFQVPEIWNLLRLPVLVTTADLDFRFIWGFGVFLSTLLHGDEFSFVRISAHYFAIDTPK